MRAPWPLSPRRPPLIAPPGVAGRVAFGFVVTPEESGWTVNAHGPDGRRLGRPLKGLSDSAQATLVGTLAGVEDPAELTRHADAWQAACRAEVTNADVLMVYLDAVVGRDV